jgi:phosphotransferase system HPr (HPr) family protein
MLNKHLTVKIPEGLHFRAVVKISKISREQQCQILLLKNDGEAANSASLLEMLSLGAVSGTELHVSVIGNNEQGTLSMVQDVFENGAGI